jgi:hypothetical protein
MRGESDSGGRWLVCVSPPAEGETDDVISCLYDRHCNLSFCPPFLAWEAAGGALDGEGVDRLMECVWRS